MDMEVDVDGGDGGSGTWTALEDLKQRMREKAGWVATAPVHPLARVDPVWLPGPAVGPGGRPLDPKEVERRRLWQRWLESEGSDADVDDDDEEDEKEGVGVVEGEEEMEARGRARAGKWALGRGKNVPFPSATAAGGEEMRLWAPRSADALLALFSATRARRRRALRALRAREDSLNLSSAASSEDEDSHTSAAATETVNCVCGSGVDDGTSMVQCDSCEYWSHMQCVGMDQDELPNTWFCRACARARKGKGRARAANAVSATVSAAAATRSTGGAVRKGKSGKLPRLRSTKKTTSSGKHGLLSPPPTGLSTTRTLALQEPSTPTRAPLQPEPTFVPADDSGIHGRAALRMKGAEILVPRTPTPSMGGPTPWLHQTPTFARPGEQPYPGTMDSAGHAQRQGQPYGPGRGQPQGYGYGVYTPQSDRKAHIYSYDNPYTSPYAVPPPLSPLKFSRPGDPVQPNSRTYYQTSKPPHPSELLNSPDPSSRRDASHPYPPSAGLGPGQYDFGSTPSRGLKFGAPFDGQAGLMTPLGFSAGPGFGSNSNSLHGHSYSHSYSNSITSFSGFSGPPPTKGAGAGGEKRRSWEFPPAAGIAGKPPPSWGLLTPVVGDDSPRRDRDRSPSHSPTRSPVREGRQGGKGHARLPSYGFSNWIITSPELPNRTAPVSATAPAAPGQAPNASSMSESKKTLGLGIPLSMPGSLGAPFSLSSERVDPSDRNERAGARLTKAESDEEGDVRHMIEQM